MALDVLRAMRKGDVTDALMQELAPARGQHPALDRMIDAVPTLLDVQATETTARSLARDVALTVQGALLAQTAPAAVVGAFCDSRLTTRHDVFGTLGAGADTRAILQRARPA